MLIKKEFTSIGKCKNKSQTWRPPAGNVIQTCVINKIEESSGAAITLIASTPRGDGEAASKRNISHGKPFHSTKCTAIIAKYNGTKRKSRATVSVSIFYQKSAVQNTKRGTIVVTPTTPGTVISSLADTPSTLHPVTPPRSSSRPPRRINHHGSPPLHVADNEDADPNLVNPPSLVRKIYRPIGDEHANLSNIEKTENIPATTIPEAPNKENTVMPFIASLAALLVNNDKTLLILLENNSKIFIFGVGFILLFSLIFFKWEDLSKYKVYNENISFSFQGKVEDRFIWQAPPGMIILYYDFEPAGLERKKCTVTVTVNLNKDNAAGSFNLPDVSGHDNANINRSDAKAPVLTNCATLLIKYKGNSCFGKANGAVKVFYVKDMDSDQSLSRVEEVAEGRQIECGV